MKVVGQAVEGAKNKIGKIKGAVSDIIHGKKDGDDSESVESPLLSMSSDEDEE